nr:hypothetical protein [Tanacetum cinerariifolium]
MVKHLFFMFVIHKTCGDADADRDGKICKEERKEFALYLRLLKNTNVPDVDNIAPNTFVNLRHSDRC